MFLFWFYLLIAPPGVALIVSLATVLLLLATKKRRRDIPILEQLVTTPDDLRASTSLLDPTGFEQWSANMLWHLGWIDIQRIGGSGDRGVDVIGTRDGERYVVQCKHYPDRNVPPAAVRELIGTLHVQQAHKAILVTSGKFSDQCWKEAHAHPVELWDFDRLSQLLYARLSQQFEPTPEQMILLKREKAKARRNRVLWWCILLVNGLALSCAFLGFVARFK
jgi:restriction system protein